MFAGCLAGGHFQRNVSHLVFCVIVFHVSNDSFSFSDYSFLNEKAKKKNPQKPQKTVSDSPTDRVCRFYLVLLIGHLGNDGIFSDL